MQNCSSPKATNYAFGLECLGTAAQITTGDWAKVAGDTQLLPWISEKIQTSTAGQARLADDLLLQIVILCGSMTGQPDGARSVMKIVPDLIQLLTSMYSHEMWGGVSLKKFFKGLNSQKIDLSHQNLHLRSS